MSDELNNPFNLKFILKKLKESIHILFKQIVLLQIVAKIFIFHLHILLNLNVNTS